MHKLYLSTALAATIGCGQALAPSSPRTDRGTVSTLQAGAISGGNQVSIVLVTSGDAAKPGTLTTPGACTPTWVAPPLQRLTSLQYKNSVSQLLGGSGAALSLPKDDNVGPLSINTLSLPTDLTISQYEAVATALGQQYAANPNATLACPVTALTSVCMQNFIAQFGLAAYRRPLTADEVKGYLALVQANLSALDGAGALKQVISAFLQSPYFLYRPELGKTGAVVAGTAPALTNYELASRLSFALWNQAPDATLLAAANAGTLTSAAAVAAQAKRLVADSRFGANGAAFVAQLLGIAPVEKIPTKASADFTPALYAAMLQETNDFTSYVYTMGDGKLDTLYGGNYTLLTPPLFSFYGITQPAGWTAGQPVAYGNLGQRSGVLTQAAFLANQSHVATTSPVYRGKIVRENLLCQGMPPPPPDTPMLPDINPKGLTEKQILGQHEANAACAACHRLMDTIGLAYEHYSATGAWQTTEFGLPIDASGTFASATIQSTAFTDALSLGKNLAANADAQRCMVLQTFRYTQQRAETTADTCMINNLASGFSASNRDLKALAVSIVTDPSFTGLPASP